MFFGWLKKEYLTQLETLEKEYPDIDKVLIQTSYAQSPNLCFGAYYNNELVGILTTYEFDEYLYVNTVYSIENNFEIKAKLFELLFNNIDPKTTIITLSRVEDAKAMREKFGFISYAPFTKVAQRGESVSYNFSDAMAKQINSDKFDMRAREIDNEVYRENRVEYLSSLFDTKTSLGLSTQTGALHSYVVNKSYARINPWVMKLESFMEAEKLLRGVLYYRGLKVVYGYIPSNIDEIVELYHQYKFKDEGHYRLQYIGKRPDIRLESLYAL